MTHYFPKVKAAVIKISDGSLSLKDTIRLKGHTTDFKQNIVSMQIDRRPIEKAQKPDEIGLRVNQRVRINDQVYKLL
ncbi:MAG: hypothetical protein COV72_01100 [Candidatus Omnitrophica bacterium CG11_big_fil_rev_8_21_14_0_20_42_13]|uniref:Translation elongation factor-like protein n=1 Tax=Candidatus Ghiorseimicrobium undicola TaxID=1974746 RepID=A0A2H0M1P4_9BACT|nr:MAG: hypothetical protein COV72_01100 [Candidatus Omnitrophica bacterium CG11_big_fil_rev_8_21_14_0_20_42_13]